MSRRALVLAMLIVGMGPAARVQAQASVYGVLGIGMPSRPVSVRSRALGDGVSAADPGSAVNPAALGLSQRLTVSGVSETTNRKFSAGDVSSDNLRDTRFPFAMVSSRIQSLPITFALSYSTYTERSYDVETMDTVSIRGADVEVKDRLKSDGGVADIRVALAWSSGQRFQVGAGVHILSGSTREQLQRTFSDPIYMPVSQRGDVDYTGWGLSFGVVATPLRTLRVGAAVRRDSRLSVNDALLPALEIQLPWTVSADVILAPVRLVRVSVSAQHRSWSVAQSDVPEWTTLTVFDTWELGSGLEVGGPDVGAGRFPLRLGFRYAQLPFSPTSDQPREMSLSAGSGVVFASSRASFEFSLERVMRDGGGATERAWQLALGLTLRP